MNSQAGGAAARSLPVWIGTMLLSWHRRATHTRREAEGEEEEEGWSGQHGHRERREGGRRRRRERRLPPRVGAVCPGAGTLLGGRRPLQPLLSGRRLTEPSFSTPLAAPPPRSPSVFLSLAL